MTIDPHDDGGPGIGQHDGQGRGEAIGQGRGWLTARGQIAFLVGLVIAFSAIFALERVDFSRTADPLGVGWMDRRSGVPFERLRSQVAPEVRQRMIGTATRMLADRMLAERTGAQPTLATGAALLGYAACVHMADPCAERLAPTMDSGHVFSGGPDLALDRFMGLLGATSLMQHDRRSQAALAYWRDAAHALAVTGAVLLPNAPGHAQFGARTSQLVGLAAPVARNYTSLAPYFENADGFTRAGLENSRTTAEGLALIATAYRDDGASRRLSWYAAIGLGGRWEDLPTGLLALWWRLFNEPGVEEALSARLVSGTWVGPGGPVRNVDLAMILLAFASLDAGPLVPTLP